jgi:hypothetical protein
VASLVLDDIAEVNRIVTVFSLLAVLGYPPLSVSVGQAFVSAGRGCFFTSGVFRPISRPVSNGGLAPMVAS